jgi:UDP-N-acetylglucosamine--N-acetylmuramyl-(pentapeptide) pyrophosphoryl-undecaprenol N-acetylglucosamine transferase
MTMQQKTVLLCAGGTGGHVFPAQALAYELKKCGWIVHFATDERAFRFADTFPTDFIYVVPSATIASKNPIKLFKTAYKLWSGYRSSRKLIMSIKPSIVVGFGGYPTLPPLIAALRLNLPTLIHEQNAVMGRANRFLAKWVNAIAGGFLPETGATYPDKTIVTGNPVRPAVLEAAKTTYDLFLTGGFRLLVFGGSQGAQYFSQIIPEAVALLPDGLKQRIHITQQARESEQEFVRAAYAALSIKADVSPFFTDMATRIGASHFVISRSGASTVAELAVIGRPSLLVPYPLALDHDQAANAAALCKAGGAIVIQQHQLTPRIIADHIIAIATDPQKAAQLAKAARATAIPNSTQLLVALVEAISLNQSVIQFKKERAA